MPTPPISSYDENRARVLLEVLNAATITRAQIADSTGISGPSVSRVVRDLLEEDYIESGEAVQQEGAGRKAVLFHPSPSTGCVVGYDIGLVFTRIVVTDLSGNTLAASTSPTPPMRSEDIAGGVVQEMRGIEQRFGTDRPIRGLVISVPGRVTGGRVIEDDRPELREVVGEDLVERLEQELSLPLRLENDSSAALAYELEHGAARESSDVVLISVSQTVTAAIALGRKPLVGSHMAAGHVRSLLISDSGERVGESISITALQADLERLGEGEEGWEKLQSPDAELSEALKRVRERFISGLVLVTSALAAAVDPEIIVFDGRAVPLVQGMMEEIEARLRRSLVVLPAIVTTDQEDLYSSALGAAKIASDLATVDLLENLHRTRRSKSVSG